MKPTRVQSQLIESSLLLQQNHICCVLWHVAFVMFLRLHYTVVGHTRLGDSSSDWELALVSGAVNFWYPVGKFLPKVQHSSCVPFPPLPLRALGRLSPLRKCTSGTCFLLSPGRCTGLGFCELCELALPSYLTLSGELIKAFVLYSREIPGLLCDQGNGVFHIACPCGF